MFNLLIALGAGIFVFALVAAWLGPIAAVIPGLVVAVVAYLLLSYRIGQIVQKELAPVALMLQERKIDESVAHMRAVQARWGRWQFLLSGQIDAQIGMIDYLQLKFDEAFPKLQAGRWRNWMALTAIGCIHWRRGDKAAAFASLEKATDAAPKEAFAWIVRATLLSKADRRDEALRVLDLGLKTLPDSAMLKELQATIANKKKIDTKAFGQSWHQFFPEELAQQMNQQMVLRGRKDGQQQMMPPGMQAAGAAPREPLKLNRKMRRTTK